MNCARILAYGLVVSLISVGAPAQNALPDPARTPGALNPAVTQRTIWQTICVIGWTRTIRPGQKYIARVKREQISDWQYTDENPRHYVEDHLIPLELGGAAEDVRNLWPEPKVAPDGWKSSDKDYLEGVLNRLVCYGHVSLADAQRAFSEDWRAAYARFVGE